MKRVRRLKKPLFSSKGHHVRGMYALALLACVALVGIVYAVLRSENTTLTYALLSVRLPFFQGVDVPTPKEPDSEGGVPVIEGTDVDPGVGQEIRIEIAGKNPAKPNVDLSGSEPKILIYHTHTTEAYTQTKAYPYKQAGDQWRTMQNDRNIVAVGEKLAKLLTERYGISVIHDITNHEPPKLGTAYSRSVVTMEKYKEQYPSITMFIDVHRDAGKTNNEGTDYVVVDGKQVARMMFVVGTGEGATGTGFKQMPDFKSNYALAKAITETMEGYQKGLTRNIRVKTGRYNQHISSQCLLVEVGHNVNTFEQAMASVDYLAAAIAQCAGLESGAAVSTSLPLLP